MINRDTRKRDDLKFYFFKNYIESTIYFPLKIIFSRYREYVTGTQMVRK